jgi:hypothetical protein
MSSNGQTKGVTLRRMPIKKVAKTHTSSRKKASASSATKRRTLAKASKQAAKPKLTKKQAEELAREKRLKRLMKLTLKAFQMAYEDNQRGEFHRL